MTVTQSNALTRIQTHAELPTLPAIMTRVLEVIDDDDTSVSDIASILSSDPVITSRVLRLANSAFYGSRFQVDTIHRAVVTVGFETVKQMTLATTVLRSFSNCRQHCLAPEDFWLHSLGSAKAAQLLAYSTPQISMPETCFTAGLLHTMGKFLLSLALKDEYSEVLRRAAEEPCRVAAMERRMLQTDHAEAGAWLMRLWGFPAVIVNAVRHAGCPENYVGPFRREIETISLAGEMARVAEFGHAGETLPAELEEQRLESLGLTMSEVVEICDTLAIMKDDARTLLGLLHQA